MMFFKKKKIEFKNELSFFWMEENFIDYDWPEYVNGYPYVISLFEAEESSFDPDVAKIFVEIADRITEKHTVLHMVDGHFSEICSGLDKKMFQQQIDTRNGWDETELYCYLNLANAEIGQDNPCEIYFMVDMIHANMTIKCNDFSLYESIKNCMKCVLAEMQYGFSKWEALE